MSRLCLVYGSFMPVKQFIDALGSLEFYSIYEGDRNTIPPNTEETIIVPASIDPRSIPEFLMCYDIPSQLFKRLTWIIQGSEENLKHLEQLNPEVIVRETSDGTFVHIGDEVRQIDEAKIKKAYDGKAPDEDQKPFATLYLRPKSQSIKKIVNQIMPHIDAIKSRFEFTLCPVTDENTQNVPSSVQTTPALVHRDGIIYSSDAIVAFLLGTD